MLILDIEYIGYINLALRGDLWGPCICGILRRVDGIWKQLIKFDLLTFSYVSYEFFVILLFVCTIPGTKKGGTAF